MKRGEPAPWFKARAIGGAADYAFHTTAGRYVLLLFFGSLSNPHSTAALTLALNRRELFDDNEACLFGIANDPADETAGRLAPRLPGIRFLADYQGAVASQFGMGRAEDGAAIEVRPGWLLLDPMLRMVATFPIDQGEAALAALKSATGARSVSQPDWAPVVMIPEVFDPSMCRRLITEYETHGGKPSGFMREVGGKTVLLTDPEHKQRCDYLIEDLGLRTELMACVATSIVPIVDRAFQFTATRMERYLVGSYSAGRGHFRPHRDNTTKGTAHRRFAVTINLNTGEYEGGALRFPEFGDRAYAAPPGGAIVFSCSLLHEALPVTSGQRFAFLPFLYDDAAAREREANNEFLSAEVSAYRA